MNLPGFTAEASLHRTDLQYKAVGLPTPTDNLQVIPQISCYSGTIVPLDGGAVKRITCCEGFGGRWRDCIITN